MPLLIWPHSSFQICPDGFVIWFSKHQNSFVKWHCRGLNLKIRKPLSLYFLQYPRSWTKFLNFVWVNTDLNPCYSFFLWAVSTLPGTPMYHSSPWGQPSPGEGAPSYTQCHRVAVCPVAFFLKQVSRTAISYCQLSRKMANRTKLRKVPEPLSPQKAYPLRIDTLRVSFQTHFVEKLNGRSEWFIVLNASPESQT